MNKYEVYPSYKDSGVVWLGDVPKHWEVKKLKHIKSYESNSFVDGPFGSNFKAQHFLVLGDVYVIESNFATQNQLNINKLKMISKEHFMTINRSQAKGGDIIIAKIGAQFGKSSILPELQKPAVVSGNSLKLTVNTLICTTKYIHFILIHLKNEGAIDDMVNSTAQPAISLFGMNNLSLSLPPLQEQKTIANYLDKATEKIDTLIEKQTKLIELLKEKRQALISTAVTRGLDPTVAMKDSGVEWLGEIPEGWNAKKLKFISTVNDETLPDDTSDDLEIKYIDIGSVTTGYIQSYEQMPYSRAPSRARRIIKDGDILVSTVRTYLKAIAPVSILYDNYIASTGFAVIRSGKELDSSFTKYALLSNYFIDLVESRSVGVSYPAINASDLVKFSIELPSIKEQQTISNFLDNKTSKIDNLITKSTKAIDLLKEKRTALISSVVTGKVDVRKEN